MPWLTPESLGEGAVICRPLFIPDDPRFIMAVSGALYDLALEENWELFGAVTPAAAAAAGLAMLDRYFLDSCEGIPTVLIGALVTRSNNLSFPFSAVATWEDVVWNGGAWDPSQPDRLTAPQAGIYQIGATLHVSLTTAAGEMFVDLRVGGALLARSAMVRNATIQNGVHLIEVQAELAAGDVVQIMHPPFGSGGTYTIASGGIPIQRFYLRYIGEA